MRISKKEKILLLVLFVILVGAGYYIFFFQKHNEELAFLNEEVEAKELEYDMLNSRLIAATGIEDKIKENTEKIVTISEKNYGDLKQENQTVLIKRLARDTGLIINSISYSNEITNLADLKSGYQTKLLDQLAEEIQRGNDIDVEDINQAGEAGGSGEPGQEGMDSPEGEAEDPEAEELLQNALVDVLRAEISFTGTYQDLDKYLKNIYDYNKEIIVSDFSFSTNNPETKEGNLTLSFYGVRDLKHFVSSERIFKKKSTRGEGGLAFLPYSSFVVAKEEGESGDGGILIKNPYDDLSKFEPNYITREDNEGKTEEGAEDAQANNTTNSNEGTEADSEDKELKRDPSAVSLDSFENFDFFFVGSKSVEGDIHPSTVAFMDSKSAKLSFNFKNPELKNRAYLVFDKNKKLIYTKSTEIGLSYFLDKDFADNKMGLVLVDSAGTEFELYFEIKPEKGKWRHASVQTKNEFVYPLMVQRLFVEGEGMNQLLSGTIYFDDLRYKAEQAQ